MCMSINLGKNLTLNIWEAAGWGRGKGKGEGWPLWEPNPNLPSLLHPEAQGCTSSLQQPGNPAKGTCPSHPTLPIGQI